MKEIKIRNVFVLFVAMLGLASCLKKDEMNIDTEDTTPTVILLQFIENGSGSTINSGLQYFGGGALTYPGSDESDTATYNINIGGPATLGSDLNVTIGVDATKLLDNYKADSIPYELMPDSLYHMLENTAVIKAGERTVPMRIVFFPSKIDVTKSYMLPLVVKDAGGHVISSNFGTIYFHVIGNPLAGAYKWDWSRWDAPDSTSKPLSSLSFTEEPTTFSPDNPTTFQVGTGYYTGPRYIVSFTNNAGVISNFQVKFNAKDIEDATTASGGGVTFGPITILKADPVNKIFVFQYIAYSGTSPRYIVDKYYK